MIDRRQHGEKHKPDAEAPADQLFLDGQQWLDGRGSQFFAQI